MDEDPINSTVGAAVIRGDGIRVYGMDAEIEMKMQSKRDLSFESSLLKWIEQVIVQTLAPPDDLPQSLRSGVALCTLINSIQPKTIKTINTRPIELMQVENIGLYLKACWKLGVPSADLFVTSDLFMRKNIPQVVQNIHSLTRVAQTIPEFKGPSFGPQASSHAKKPAKKWNMIEPNQAVYVQDLEKKRMMLQQQQQRLNAATTPITAQDLGICFACGTKSTPDAAQCPHCGASSAGQTPPDLVTLIKDLYTARMQCNDIQSKNGALAKMKDDLEASIRKQVEEVALERQQATERLAAEIAASTLRTQEASQTVLEEMEQKASERANIARTEIRALQRERDDLQTRLEDIMGQGETSSQALQAHIKALEEGNAKLVRMRDSSMQQADTIGHALHEEQKARLALEDEIEALSGEVAQEARARLMAEEAKRTTEASLSGTRDQMHAQMHAMEAKVKTLEGDLSFAERRIEQERAMRAATEEQHGDADKALRDMQEQMLALEQRSRLATEANARRDAELEAARAQHQADADALARLEVLKATLQRDVAEMTGRLAGELTARTSAEKTNKKLQRDLAEVTTSLEQAQGATSDVQQQRQAVQEEVESLTRRLEEEATRRTVQEAALATLQNTLADIRGRSEAETTHRTSADKAKAALEGQLRDVAAELTSAKHAHETAHKKASSLEELLRKMQGQLAAEGGNKRLLEGMKVQHEAEVADMASTIELHLATIAHLQAEKRRLEDVVPDLEARMEREINDKLAFEKEKRRLESDLTNLNIRMEAELKERASLEKIRHKLEEEIASQSSNLSDEQKSRKQRDRQVRELTLSLEEATDELEEARSERDAVEKAKGNLLTELALVDATLAETNKTLADTKRQVTDLETTLRATRDDLERLQSGRTDLVEHSRLAAADLSRVNASLASEMAAKQHALGTVLLLEEQIGALKEAGVVEVANTARVQRALDDAQHEMKDMWTKMEETKRSGEKSERKLARVREELLTAQRALEERSLAFQADHDRANEAQAEQTNLSDALKAANASLHASERQLSERDEEIRLIRELLEAEKKARAQAERQRATRDAEVAAQAVSSVAERARYSNDVQRLQQEITNLKEKQEEADSQMQKIKDENARLASELAVAELATVHMAAQQQQQQQPQDVSLPPVVTIGARQSVRVSSGPGTDADVAATGRNPRASMSPHQAKLLAVEAELKAVEEELAKVDSSSAPSKDPSFSTTTATNLPSTSTNKPDLAGTGTRPPGRAPPTAPAASPTLAPGRPALKPEANAKTNKRIMRDRHRTTFHNKLMVLEDPNSSNALGADSLVYMEDMLTKVMLSHPLDSVNVARLKTAMATDAGRRRCVQILHESTKDIQTLVLSDQCFEFLVVLLHQMMKEIDVSASKDHIGMRKLMQASATLAKKTASGSQELLSDHIKGHDIWKSKLFWSEYFWGELVKTHRKTLKAGFGDTDQTLAAALLRSFYIKMRHWGVDLESVQQFMAEMNERISGQEASPHYNEGAHDGVVPPATHQHQQHVSLQGMPSQQVLGSHREASTTKEARESSHPKDDSIIGKEAVPTTDVDTANAAVATSTKPVARSDESSRSRARTAAPTVPDKMTSSSSSSSSEVKQATPTHVFVDHALDKPVHCNYCTLFISLENPDAAQCEECMYTIHRKCMSNALRDVSCSAASVAPDLDAAATSSRSSRRMDRHKRQAVSFRMSMAKGTSSSPLPDQEDVDQDEHT